MATCRSTPSGLPIGRYTRPRILQSMHLSIYPSIYRGYPGNLYHPKFYLYRARFLTSIHIHPSSIHHSSVHLPIHFTFLLSLDLSIHPFHIAIYLSMPAQVEEKLWGTLWMVTQEIVCWHLSTTAVPTIPTWYRYTEDKQRVICLN